MVWYLFVELTSLLCFYFLMSSPGVGIWQIIYVLWLFFLAKNQNLQTAVFIMGVEIPYRRMNLMEKN